MSDTKFEAVIFDCDGTLVDSEKVSIAVLVEYVGRFGFQIDLAEALARWAGGELPKVFAQIQADLHAPLPPDHIDQFRPHVAVLLNITPDHLDCYQYRFDLYAASKSRIFENLAGSDTLIYNIDDPHLTTCVNQALTTRSFRTLGISTSRDVEAGAFVRKEAIVLRVNQEEEVLMEREQLALRD